MKKMLFLLITISQISLFTSYLCGITDKKIVKHCKKDADCTKDYHCKDNKCIKKSSKINKDKEADIINKESNDNYNNESAVLIGPRPFKRNIK